VPPSFPRTDLPEKVELCKPEGIQSPRASVNMFSTAQISTVPRHTTRECPHVVWTKMRCRMRKKLKRI
jgi:hypothetical protein